MARNYYLIFMIYFEKVSKIYSDNSAALEEIDLVIEPHEFVSIVGQSGAGKSTLLKLLLREDRPSSGKIFFESIDISRIPRNKIHNLRRKIGSVFQDYKLLATKTAFENVAFAMEASGADEDQIESDVPQVLELVGLKDKICHFPNELSGGEKQRLAIARAIINQPEVILADEPTGNLDPINTVDIIKLLMKINELGTTVILTTHNKDIVDHLNKRVITLESGKLIRDEKHGKYVL